MKDEIIRGRVMSENEMITTRGEKLNVSTSHIQFENRWIGKDVVIRNGKI